MLFVALCEISAAEENEGHRWKKIIEFEPEPGTKVDNFQQEKKKDGVESGEDKVRRQLEWGFVAGKSFILSDVANEAWDSKSPYIVDGYYEDALDEARLAWGANHPVYGYIARNFAEYLLYSSTKRPEKTKNDVKIKAEAIANLAHRIMEDKLPFGHPLLADSFHTMAHIAAITGNKNASLKYLKHALAMYKLDAHTYSAKIAKIEAFLGSRP